MATTKLQFRAKREELARSVVSYETQVDRIIAQLDNIRLQVSKDITDMQADSGFSLDEITEAQSVITKIDSFKSKLAVE